MFSCLEDFYTSKEWQQLRKIIIAERMKEDGFVYDEITGKPIVKAYDIILHHKTELTEENVNDFEISLNPDNIMIVSHLTHNAIHNKLSYKHRTIYLCYGSPLSGKSSYVLSVMNEGDLIIDMDNIWEAVSGLPRYTKPNRLKGVAFKVRDCLLECVKYRNGKFKDVYIVGGYPLRSERERICKELGAIELYIEATKEECLQRLESLPETDGRSRQKEEWKQFIERWFDDFTESD